MPEICLVCDTELIWCGDAGWRHAVGFKDRDGCTSPIAADEIVREHGWVDVEEA